MVLGRRLKKITDMIPKCRCIADIGTDHAYIPIYCVTNNICISSLACDVKEGPLIMARKNIEEHNLSEKIETRLSNGLENISTDEVDTFVIAGMGGLLISDILQRGKENITHNAILILQPMTAVPELREYLYKNGFDILDECLIDEGEKIYNVLKVKKGEAEFVDFDIYIGKHLLKDVLFTRYISNKIRTNQKIIYGIEKSDDKKDLGLYLTMREMYTKAETMRGELR